jgi:hypothetical protein
MLLNCQLSTDTTSRVPCRFMFKEVAAPDKPQRALETLGIVMVTVTSLPRHSTSTMQPCSNIMDLILGTLYRQDAKENNQALPKYKSRALPPDQPVQSKQLSFSTSIVVWQQIPFGILTIQPHFAVWLFHISTMKNIVQSM